MVDKFIILANVDFSKNNFQNRYFINEREKWVTKSVIDGREPILDKKYTDGKKLFHLNMSWIMTIKETLNIDTEILYDYPTDFKGTDRLIDLIKHYGGNVYVTNPEAKYKYLDENLMRKEGIEIEYCKPPRYLQKHIFEIFEQYGIDGTITQLPKKEMVCV